MSAWKPGDVGIARVHSDDLPAWFSPTAGRLVDVVVTRNSQVWVLAGCSDYWWTDENHPDLKVRPLFVIDPEDREQVERLMVAMDEWSGRVPYDDMREPGDLTNVDAAQAALRSLLAPPKPDEPTGLGAVVIDEDGMRWTRFQDYDPDDNPWAASGDVIGNRSWSDIAAVRVLSEGVAE